MSEHYGSGGMSELSTQVHHNSRPDPIGLDEKKVGRQACPADMSRRLHGEACKAKPEASAKAEAESKGGLVSA